jgi:hypothetical protein
MQAADSLFMGGGYEFGLGDQFTIKMLLVNLSISNQYFRPASRRSSFRCLWMKRTMT